MGEARRRKDEIAAKKYRGRAKDLPKNQKPKIRFFKWKDPSLSTREMTEIVQKKMKGEGKKSDVFDLINPEAERR